MRHRDSATFEILWVDSSDTESIHSQCSSTGSSCSSSNYSLTVNVAARGRQGTRSRGVVMQTFANRAEAKVQAISWLVSQLRWERTLGALRHDRNAGALDDSR